jgi:DNA polymerase III epsilon subunit family exonuclease
MSGFDQLGLFSVNKPEQGSKEYAVSATKLSLTIESSSLNRKKIDEMVKKITKEIEQFDNKALISSKTDEDERPWHEMAFLAVDVETTGLDAVSNRVIELALVPFNMPDDVKPFCQLFSVGESLSQEIINITGISDDMLKGKPAFKECADECVRLMSKASFMVAYNAKFDRPFLESEMARLEKVLPDLPWIDPFVFICELDRFKRGKKLSDSAKRWGVNLENAHRAMADAMAAGKLMLKMADAAGCHSLDALLTKQKIWQWRNAHNMAELKRSSLWSTNR